MVAITDTPDNRRRLKDMTLEKWKNTALESQYRWILVCNKIVSEGGSDYLEDLGVTEEEKVRIIGERNQKRQTRIIKEKLEVVQTREALLQRNRELEEQIEDHEGRIFELAQQVETIRIESKKSIREIQAQYEDKLWDLQDELSEIKAEKEILQVKNNALCPEFDKLKLSIKESLESIRNFGQENANYFGLHTRLNRFNSYVADIDLQMAKFKDLISLVQSTDEVEQ
jgi:chromosome segregation ATPase